MANEQKIHKKIKSNEQQLADIGAMKAQAVVDRGTKRDFIDIHILIKTVGLEKIMAASAKKYPTAHNPYLILQALSYFEDAESEPMAGRNEVLKKFDWRTIKKDILAAVSAYKKTQV